MAMIAQALVERGMLEGMSLGIANFFTQVGDNVVDHPYMTVLGVVIVGFLLIRRR